MHQLDQKITAQLEQVDQKILETAASYPPVIAEFIEQIVKAGGKHLRSKVCLAFSHAHQIDSQTAVSLSAGLEILHLATLIHDDLIDQSDLRRGVTPIHKRIGIKSTILFGDVLFGIAAQYVAGTDNPKMSHAFAETVETIARAELLNSITKRDKFDKTQAIQLAYTKTGILFELAAKIALYQNNQIEQIQKATTFGKEFGIAYQLIDDLLDLEISSNGTNKTNSKDLANQTITMPYIIYFQSLSQEKKNEFTQMLDQKQYRQIQERVKQSQAIQATKQEIENRIKKAKEALLLLPSDAKSYLENIIDQSIHLLH